MVEREQMNNRILRQKSFLNPSEDESSLSLSDGDIVEESTYLAPCIAPAYVPTPLAPVSFSVTRSDDILDVSEEQVLYCTSSQAAVSTEFEPLFFVKEKRELVWGGEILEDL
jgi:hypothetical protein